MLRVGASRTLAVARVGCRRTNARKVLVGEREPHNGAIVNVRKPSPLG